MAHYSGQWAFPQLVAVTKLSSYTDSIGIISKLMNLGSLSVLWIHHIALAKTQ